MPMKTLIPANVIDDYLKSIEVTDLNKASIRQVLACALHAEKVTGQEFIHFEMGVPGLPASAIGIQ
nr:pyridoxal phosphate-dependent aminotransferase [Bacteroidaceae bacterium]